ncbi:MAG: hemerythrin domain-containing protein [Candidatus Hadarchaeota archaeon]
MVRPIGQLMVEHRLIGRMARLLDKEQLMMAGASKVNLAFIDSAVDFFRTYADRCHHGKEEDILFRDLAKKSLSQPHKKVMDELVEEHVWARKNVRRLADVKEEYTRGNAAALKEMVEILKALRDFYQAH